MARTQSPGASFAPGLAMAELKPGDDVEFCVVRDPTPEQPKRIVATRCFANAVEISCCPYLQVEISAGTCECQCAMG